MKSRVPDRVQATVFYCLRYLVVIATIGQIAHADQVGIDKVRLFEAPGGEYLLEVDAAPRFIPAYRDPVLPERFDLTESDQERQSGYVVLRYQFHSLGQEMTSEDELLLPWGRAGASITAQWSDGSIHQHLFLRDFEGIRVPIRMLKPSQKSRNDFALAHFRAGLRHVVSEPNHWLLAVAVGLLAVGWWRIRLVLLFAAGHAISLILTDLGPLVVAGEVAEVCVVIVALLLARAAPLDSEHCRRFAPVMIIAGVLHGLAISSSLRQTAGATEFVQVLFLFNVGVDVAQVAVATLCAIVGSQARRAGWQRALPVAVGGMSIGLLLVSLTGNRITNRPDQSSDQTATPFELPGAQMVLPGNQSRPGPPRNLRQPVACFLNIEPYETRVEVLVRLASARQWLDLPASGSSIEPADQQQLTEAVIDLIANQLSVAVDGVSAKPDIRRADFVTVAATGVYSRPASVPEAVDEAIVGVTFVFDTGDMAKEIVLQWSLFGKEVTNVLATTTDPFGGNQQALTPNNPRLTWNSRWPGYKPPQIKPVAVSRPQIPLFSILMLAVAIGLFWYFGQGNRGRATTAPIIILLILAYVSYPFARVPVGAATVMSWQNSERQISDVLDRLLTNVYRAFDMRDEEAIYDRLALTVSGELLTEVYLDMRRSLELENRGGARAKVDEVAVQDVHAIESVDDGGFTVDVTWIVSGSVTHFGHTHYRRNRNRAVVTIAPADKDWKLRSIQIVEEQRVL